MQALVPLENKKCKVLWRHLGTKIGKVGLYQIIESLGQKIIVSEWHSTGKSLEVLK